MVAFGVPESATGTVLVSLLVGGKTINTCVEHGEVSAANDRIDDLEVIML